MTLKIHSAHDRPKGSRLTCGKGKTKQQFTDECNINKIMSRYLKTGNIDHLATHGAMYGDFTSLEFQDALEIVARGEEMFLDLSSDLRKKFNQDPKEFLAFVQNPENTEEMYTLGLATRPEPPAEPTPPAPAPDPAPAPPTPTE